MVFCSALQSCRHSTVSSIRISVNCGLTRMVLANHPLAMHESDSTNTYRRQQRAANQIAILHATLLLSSLCVPLTSVAKEPPVTSGCQASLDRTVLEFKRIGAWGGRRNLRSGHSPSTIGLNNFDEHNNYLLNGNKNPWKGTRDSFVAITVGETGAANVEKSPKFMARIAKDIISSCPNVALVKFWTGYEWGPEIGLLEDGSVKMFDCHDRSRHSVGQDIPWGKDDCCC
jgi:hypothetical protein